MSSDKPPEFFLDRSLGKTSASRLRAAGHFVHLIAEYYPRDAQDIGDAEWIAEGCGRGWTLLTKDRRIRYRTDELAALAGGHLFCLADGNANLDQITQRLLDAMPAIHRAIQNTDVGFWHVHTSGRITKMWP
jgi:PIN like domain